MILIQEIVNRAGYNANNSISIIISGTGERTAESYNGSSGSAPELCVTYSTCPQQGTSCDDGDACTTNDVFDADCGCAGTFADADGEGVCDADDICAGFDDNLDGDNDGIPDGCDTCDGNLEGTSCDDGDACTTNDVYDADCGCAGTFADADGDGVCDADDICAGFDDNLDGDNDGIPDGCDTCDGSLEGTACDDGDACTTNDVYDADCGCAETFADSDDDGVCDADDICAGFDDNIDTDNDGIPDGCDTCDGSLEGTSCDDGDACTTNDVFDADCGCAGTFADSDGDGVCDADDICAGFDDNLDGDNDGIPDGCDTCDGSLEGTACDDGDSCTTNDVYDADCGCAGTFADADGDGVCDADDICAGFDDNLDGDNDGIPDGCDTDECPDADGDGVCDEDDPCPTDEWDACLLPDPCDASASNTNYEFIQQVDFNTISNVSGNNNGYADFTNLYTIVNNGLTYDITLTPGFVGSSYNEVWRVWIDFNKDGDFTDANETVVSANSSGVVSASIAIPQDVNTNGITIMRVAMQYNSTPSSCGTFTYGEVEDYHVVILNDCTEGESCDDGDACTINDAYDENCNCVGVQDNDTDNDGICDSLDECPGMDDNLIGQACDDGDDCTTGDVYGVDCNCSGTYTDNDNDGICVGDDPDDNDECIPNDEGCDSCDEITSDGFEVNYGNWNDGGGDCTRVSSFPNSGVRSIRLRDNSGSSSSMYTDVLDLSSYDELTIEFSYYPNSMENGEDFMLEVSTNGGSTYSIIQSWVRGVDFNNGTRYDESVVVNSSFLTANTVVRLRCDASGNGDQIYVDDVVMTGCTINGSENNNDSFAALIFNSNSAASESNEVRESLVKEEIETTEFKFYPNPTTSKMFIKADKGISNSDQLEIQLLDYTGNIVKTISLANINDGAIEIDIQSLTSGMYFAVIRNNNSIVDSQKILILE